MSGDDASAGSGSSSDPGTRADHDGDREGPHGETESASARFWLTNDLIAFGLVFGYFGIVVLVGLGRLDPGVLGGNSGLALNAFVAAAIAWAFGTDALRAWRGR